MKSIKLVLLDEKGNQRDIWLTYATLQIDGTSDFINVLYYKASEPNGYLGEMFRDTKGKAISFDSYEKSIDYAKKTLSYSSIIPKQQVIILSYTLNNKESFIGVFQYLSDALIELENHFNKDYNKTLPPFYQKNPDHKFYFDTSIIIQSFQGQGGIYSHRLNPSDANCPSYHLIKVPFQ